MILPATTYMEKDGTYTNTDRRVQLGRKALDPPGEARADWQIIQDIANRVGLPMDYEHPSEIFDELVSRHAQLRRPDLREPGLDRQALPQPRSRALATARWCSSTSASAPTTGRRTSCPPSGCRRRSCPTTSTRSSSTPAGCWSTGTPGSMTRRSFALDAIQPEAARLPEPGRRGAAGRRRRRLRRASARGAGRSSCARGSRTATRRAPASSRSTSARRRRTC